MGSEKPLAQQKLADVAEWAAITPGTRINKIPPLFPRIDTGRAS